MGHLRLRDSALRTFETVARHGSVTRAAGEMHVTPGAVSQQVRQLERSLNVELFLRQHRKIVLTDSGRLLAGRLTELFDSIDRAVVEVAGDPRSKKLRLRVSPTFAIRWLVPRLTSFYEQHQDFEIEVGTYIRQEDVAIEDVDFVVRHGRGNWDDAVSDLLFWDALSPVCCPAIAKRLHSPKDLASQNLLHSMLRTDGWDSWLRSQGVGALRPKRSIKLSSAAVTYQAAIDGQGVALGQQAYLRDDLTSGRLVQPFDHVLHTGSGYWVSFAKHKANQPNIRLIREWMRSLVS